MRTLAMLLVLALVSTVHAAVTITETKLDTGRTAVVMENDFLRAVFEPDRGGQCTGLLFKPTGEQLLLANEGTVLGSRVWNYADRELYFQWQRCAWEHKVDRGPKQVRLQMRAAGQVGFTRSTLFEKQITLDDGEALLRVEQTFHVGQELMVPQKIGLWCANKCGAVGRKNVYCVPLDEGVLTLDPAAGMSQEWLYNPARGWAAVVGDAGTGLCFNMEFRRLMCFYLHGGRQPGLEWAFRTFDVPNGGSLRTETLVIPFAGPKRVHGSANGIVAGFEAPAECPLAEAQKGLPVKAIVAAGSRRAGELAVQLRRLPDGPSQEIARRPVALEPARPVAANFQVRIDREGTWVLEGRLLDGGAELVDFQTRIVVGAESGPWRIAAKEDRIGRPTERFQDQVPLRGTAPKDIELSAEVQSEHVAWARPYRQGRLKVVMLASCLNAREEIELAQRLDMEIIHVSAGLQSELDGFSGIFGSRKGFKVEHTNQYIQEQLARPCDAILIGGLRGDLFTPEVVELFQKKVAEGVGLVYTGPNSLPDKLLELLPVQKLVAPRRLDGVWQAKQSHFLTTGVPYAELPKTDYAEFRAKIEPLATVQGPRSAPLLLAQEGPGKGRVVVLTYNTGWQGSGGHKSGITPWVRNPEQKFKYWEYHFSLLAKAVLWAAHREPQMGLEEIGVDVAGPAPRLTARLAAAAPADAPSPLQAEVRVSDAYGQVEHAATVPLDAAQGRGVLQLDLPKNLPAGLHLADVIFKCQDKVVTWGTAAFRLQREAVLSKVSFDKRAYRPGEAVRVTVEGRAKDVILRLEARDSLGRLVWRADQKTPVLDDGSPVELAFTLRDPLATVLTARVSAIAAGTPGAGPLAVAQADCITLPQKFAARAWDDWESCVWGNAAGAYEREYLIPLRARLYKQYGINTVLASANWLYETEYEDAVRAGFQIMPMSVAYGALNVGHRVGKDKLPFDQARTEYQKTHDKKYLVRPVSLNDPAALASTADRLRKLADYCGWLEPIGYNLGDEMSVTHYVTPFDYDFGEPCLAAMRDWLKQRYGTLEALNREWETQFASWEQVAPMTAHEVKDRKNNFAPWADHREFMDVTFANFFRWIRDTLREKDPRAGVGLSGTQAAEAYGGYDWSRLMGAIDFAQTYTHQDTIVMHRSFDGRVPRVPWYGYKTVNPQMRHTLWRRLLEGNHGGSYFADGYMFRPDGTMTESTADAYRVVSQFQAGLAKLLANAQRVNDVGLHYSQASIRGAFITGADAFFRDNRGGWVQAIQDASFQCEFLSTAQLEAGELSRRAYRLFVLPSSLAISPGEAAALRRYVETGGVLLADVKPGLMNEHCRTLVAGSLDDLFGVARPRVEPAAATRSGEARFSRDQGQCRLAGLGLELTVAEPELRVTDGVALGEQAGTPLAVVKRHGKGAAILLNFSLDAYPRLRGLGMDKTLLQLLQNLVRLAGMEPEVRVECTPPAGARAQHFYVVRYRSGAAQYVAVQRDIPTDKTVEAVEASVTLPASQSASDVLSGQAFGRTTSVAARLAPGEAKVYALLPYEVAGIAVWGPKTTVAPGSVLDYQVSVQCQGEPGMHVFAVEVSGPDGRPRTHYAQKLVGRQGTAAGRIPLALNDDAGAWTIRATDVATRKSGELRFVLQP